MQIKLIFKTKVSLLASFWKWDFLELGNALLHLSVFPECHKHVESAAFFPCVDCQTPVWSLWIPEQLSSYDFSRKLKTASRHCWWAGLHRTGPKLWKRSQISSLRKKSLKMYSNANTVSLARRRVTITFDDGYVWVCGCYPSTFKQFQLLELAREVRFRFRTESWILEKVLKFAHQFSRPGKSPEIGD